MRIANGRTFFIYVIYNVYCLPTAKAKEEEEDRAVDRLAVRSQFIIH